MGSRRAQAFSQTSEADKFLLELVNGVLENVGILPDELVRIGPGELVVAF